MDISDKLKDLRVKNNKTQKEIAAVLNVSVSTIGMYETGKRKPDGEMLKELAKLYKVSTDYLLGHKTITPNHPNPDIAKFLTDNQIEKLEVTKDVSVEDLKELMEFYQKIKINKK
jgi:transcriptional regulator with XRE-family HTH domain